MACTKLKFYFLLLVLTGFLFSCSKKPVNPGKTPGDISLSPAALNLVKDSIYLYPAEDYLWSTSLPTSANFQPRSFTGSTDIATLQKELDALSQYAINPDRKSVV